MMAMINIVLPLVTLLLQVATTLSQTYSCTDITGVESDWSGATRNAKTTPSQLTFTTIDTDTNTATIQLAPTQSTGQLCTLFEVTTSDPTLSPVYEFYVPVGRSYDGKDWERVAGRHSELLYICPGSSGGDCEVTLPDVSSAKYYMSAYKYELTPQQSWIRFMEKSTFGPTQAALAAQSSYFSTDAMASWIENQFTLTPTSHREYFRSRLNPRSLEVYKYGTTGPHACNEGSYWRNFAFTRNDKIMSVGKIKSDWPMIFHNVTLESRTVNTGGGDVTKWVWMYAGHVRTMMNDQPHYMNSGDYSEGTEIPEGVYDVCEVDEYLGELITGTDAEVSFSFFSLWLSS